MLGTVVAADLATPLRGEEDPAFHLGVEQPFLGILALRAGGYQAAGDLTDGRLRSQAWSVALDVAADLGEKTRFMLRPSLALT